MGSLLSAENLQYLKWGKIGPRSLLMTNRKSHLRYRLVPKTMTLDDLERPFRILFQSTFFLGAHHKNLNEDGAILTAAEM